MGEQGSKGTESILTNAEQFELIFPPSTHIKITRVLEQPSWLKSSIGATKHWFIQAEVIPMKNPLVGGSKLSVTKKSESESNDDR